MPRESQVPACSARAAGCEVRVQRGGLVESVRRRRASPSGARRRRRRRAALPVFLQLRAKPFQAAPAVAAGVLERFGLDDRHLALACASHLATAEHAALAAEMLAAAGLDEGALRCGRRRRRRARVAPHVLGQPRLRARALRHGGLADRRLPRPGASAAGGDARPRSPRWRASAAEEAGDGCGMRAYRVPLGRRGACSARSRRPDGALGRCARAMRAHPIWCAARASSTPS